MAKATGKDHAEINLDIWGDDDWLDLSPPAQHLYFVLWTTPELSYCGCGPWHPGKISAKARGWTPAAVEHAAAELSREQFLLIDTTTEEFDLRSWIKHDGIWRKPNMAVSMANARAALASRTLRGVVVHEVRKIKARNIAEADEEHPVSTSWQREPVKNLLSQKAVDPATIAPFTPTLTLTSTPWPTPPPTPVLTVSGGVGVNPPADPTPAPAPAPSLLLHSPEGLRNNGSHQGQNPETPHLPRCLKHMNDPNPPNCGACADARRAGEELDQALRTAREAERRAFLREIDECDACDEHGWQLDEFGLPTDDATRCPKHDWNRHA